jgi:hypothetical protein
MRSTEVPRFPQRLDRHAMGLLSLLVEEHKMNESSD